MSETAAGAGTRMRGEGDVFAARDRRPRLPEAEHRRLRRRVRLRRELTGWAFLGPMFVFFVAFLVVPVAGTFFWSTQNGGLTSGSTFVGLENFSRLPSLVAATTAIQNTLIFAAFSIPPTLALGLGVALLLSRIRTGGAAYRFLVYFPV